MHCPNALKVFSVFCCLMHRFIVMRRMFALTGTVFMLRCITMLITSLSVPGVHLQCEPKVCGQHCDIMLKVSSSVQLLMGNFLRATKGHLPDGILSPYLLLDTFERAPP